MGNPSSIVVTVIIPVYNDVERLKLCLKALENQTFPTETYEVIVVDNHSTEPVAPLVTTFAHTRCLFEERQGSYAARNLGLSQARGEILAFTDSDCIPQKDWIERGAAAMGQDEAIGLVGGKVELFSVDPKHPTAAELYELMGAFQQKVYVEQKHFGVTANLFARRSVMDKVGPFDASLLSGGDRDWGRRVYTAGYKLIYADDVVIRHPARHSLAELRSKAVRLAEGRYRLRKNQSNNSLWRIGMNILISFLPHRRILGIFTQPDLNFGQKVSLTSVTLYMRYFQARQNLRQLWSDYRGNRSS